jgi:hypothetical protein
VVCRIAYDFWLVLISGSNTVQNNNSNKSHNNYNHRHSTFILLETNPPTRPPPLWIQAHDTDPPPAAPLSPGINPPSPSFADSSSPISVAAVALKTDPREKIAKAFGGERKLFFPHRPPAENAEQPYASLNHCIYRLWAYQRKINHRSMAMLRVSKLPPPDLSPSECLEFFGIEKNDATRGLFCLVQNHTRIFRGRVLPSVIAKKWVDNVFASSGVEQKQVAAGEELDNDNREGEFLGASLQYFPVKEQDPNDQPGDFYVNNHLGFSRQMANVVNQWLLNREVPDGHTRLLHGTKLASMVNILSKGINTSKFQTIGDFGPGFYCTDNVPTSVRSALSSALFVDDDDAAAVLSAIDRGERYGPSRAAIICVDVPKEDLRGLRTSNLDGQQEWEDFTQLCLKEDPTEPGEGCFWQAFVGEHQDAQLVVGKLMHSPHEMEKSFEDGCKRFAFTDKVGNVLLKDKTKMAVALFDVYLGNPCGEAAEHQEDEDSQESGIAAGDQKNETAG